MRVRFAPSPTGALHIGGARTALFNWLLARHEGGELVLRIEDTDRERSTPENIEQILDALRWLELDWDEGPILQTERTERHQRGAAGAARRRPRLPLERDRRGRARPTRSATAPSRGFRGEPEAAGRGAPARARPRARRSSTTSIRGDTPLRARALDDPVIARADGSVLYNFAVAIDDLDAGITHVVRGEDHLSNTPKQLLVLEAARPSASAEAPLPALRAPAAAARARRQEALQAPRRRLGAGAARRRLPARGGPQLPGAARLGRRRRRDGALDAGAGRALHARAGQPQPGALRRGQAALAERRLHPRAAGRGAGAGAWKRSPGRERAARGGARSARRRSTRSPTSGRWRARCSTGPWTTRRRASAGSTRRGARCWREARAALARGCEPFDEAAIEQALEA